MKINTKNIGMLALLAVLLIGVVLMSGCTNAPEKELTSEQRSDIQGLMNAYKIYYDENAGLYRSEILLLCRIHENLAAGQEIAITSLSGNLPIEELKGSVITGKVAKYVTLNKIEIETGSFKISKDNENKNEIILDKAITLKIGDEQQTINTIYATDAQIASLLIAPAHKGDDGQMPKGSEIDKIFRQLGLYKSEYDGHPPKGSEINWDRIEAVNNARVTYLKSYDTKYNIKIDYKRYSYKFAGSAPKDDSFMTDTEEMFKRAVQGEHDFQKIAGEIYREIRN